MFLALGLALFILGVEVHLALGYRLQRLPSNSLTDPTQISSTGPVSSSTS